ncbi:NtaA/DmoA family FMN-dependent monooxygenase [Mycolicibacterium nivoides]|uniref:NtaA/DmoA family FMN-dependent monooxygenase n=1 Tax=Mycolicibacterium nivoides TaxID=2487344 RepID=UPI003C305FFF
MTRDHMHLVMTFEPAGAGWRQQNSNAESLLTLDYYAGVAKQAEEAKLDAVFRHDLPSVDLNRIGSTAGIGIEPLTLLSAVAARTHDIGIIATASTTFSEPYNVARAFATLDHLSAGRVGWNVVTSSAGERNFNYETLPTQQERYSRAQEFIDVTRRLWRSWESDAWVLDRERGVFADIARVKSINHRGQHFKVEGPLDIPRSPQVEPVLVQAGASESGRTFAAQFAELVFTAAQSVEQAAEFRTDMRRRAIQSSRSPDDLVVLPGIKTIIADTGHEVKSLNRQLRDLIDVTAGRADLEKAMGFVDLSGIDLDETIPAERLAFDEQTLRRRQSRPALFRHLAIERKYTLRRLIEEQVISSGHYIAVGTPDTIANLLESWYRSDAADGFVIIPAVANAPAFIDGVVPILKNRGLFRRDYEYGTLRENLGFAART